MEANELAEIAGVIDSQLARLNDNLQFLCNLSNAALIATKPKSKWLTILTEEFYEQKIEVLFDPEQSVLIVKTTSTPYAEDTKESFCVDSLSHATLIAASDYKEWLAEANDNFQKYQRKNQRQHEQSNPGPRNH
jgi:hypothetical protein